MRKHAPCFYPATPPGVWHWNPIDFIHRSEVTSSSQHLVDSGDACFFGSHGDNIVAAMVSAFSNILPTLTSMQEKLAAFSMLLTQLGALYTSNSDAEQFRPDYLQQGGSLPFSGFTEFVDKSSIGEQTTVSGARNGVAGVLARSAQDVGTGGLPRSDAGNDDVPAIVPALLQVSAEENGEEKDDDKYSEHIEKISSWRCSKNPVKIRSVSSPPSFIHKTLWADLTTLDSEGSDDESDDVEKVPCNLTSNLTIESTTEVAESVVEGPCDLTPNRAIEVTTEVAESVVEVPCNRTPNLAIEVTTEVAESGVEVSCNLTPNRTIEVDQSGERCFREMTVTGARFMRIPKKIKVSERHGNLAVTDNADVCSQSKIVTTEVAERGVEVPCNLIANSTIEVTTEVAERAVEVPCNLTPNHTIEVTTEVAENVVEVPCYLTPNLINDVTTEVAENVVEVPCNLTPNFIIKVEASNQPEIATNLRSIDAVPEISNFLPASVDSPSLLAAGQANATVPGMFEAAGNFLAGPFRMAGRATVPGNTNTAPVGGQQVVRDPIQGPLGSASGAVGAMGGPKLDPKWLQDGPPAIRPEPTCPDLLPGTQKRLSESVYEQICALRDEMWTDEVIHSGISSSCDENDWKSQPYGYDLEVHYTIQMGQGWVQGQGQTSTNPPDEKLSNECGAQYVHESCHVCTCFSAMLPPSSKGAAAADACSLQESGKEEVAGALSDPSPSDPAGRFGLDSDSVSPPDELSIESGEHVARILLRQLQTLIGNVDGKCLQCSTSLPRVGYHLDCITQGVRNYHDNFLRQYMKSDNFMLHQFSAYANGEILKLECPEEATVRNFIDYLVKGEYVRWALNSKCPFNDDNFHMNSIAVPASQPSSSAVAAGACRHKNSRDDHERSCARNQRLMSANKGTKHRRHRKSSRMPQQPLPKSGGKYQTEK